MKRIEFLKTGAAAGLGLTLGAPYILQGQDDRKVRLGFIGLGGRGTGHVRRMLLRDDIVVTALCDIDNKAANAAAKRVTDTGAKKPALYTRGDEDFRRMLKRDDLDGVIISTPWNWHTPMAVAAMQAGKYAGVEVPALLTVEDGWELVDASEKTGVPCMLLENVCYRRDVMAVLNIVRAGLFGELIHAHCGYQHDLVKGRLVQDARGRENWRRSWRTPQSMKRNGDLYPTHGVGPIANMMDIDRGNRFVHLTSTATKTRGIHDYIVQHYGADHPKAQAKFVLGDIVTTVIKTAREETIVVTHDTNLPRPYSLGFRVQGTRGLWMVDNNSIYIEGRSPEEHTWESFDAYQQEFDHPLWKRYEDQATGAGHGGMDFFVGHAFVESIKRQVTPPIDVYDAVAWSVIAPLSEQSIANGSAPVQFPDYTRGKWETRKPIFALDDAY